MAIDLSNQQAPWASYWGKARPEKGTGPSWHPVVYHSLDVAASGAVLLEMDPRLLASLVRASGLPRAQVLRWIPFVLALHDLGKFSVPFQCQVPQLALELLGWKTEQVYPHRHDTIGYQFFRQENGVAERLVDDPRIQVSLGGQPCSDAFELLDALDPWMKASCGHHGRPPANSGDLPPWVYRPEARNAAFAWVDGVIDLLAPGPLDVPGESAMARSSWLVAGLAVLADWIGSNQHFFSYQPPTMSLGDYWARARGIAREAVAACGLLPSRPVPRREPAALFPEISSFSPLQRRVDALPLARGPQLWILEDVTGSGKTEAALILAHRLMAEGLADGLYFALPTMATANGMHRRIEGLFERLFDGSPSLTLAHGKTTLFRALQEIKTDIDPDPDNLSASRHGAAWLADNRKKALLASVGVGTIDQALLSVLPSKHSPLRTLGLHRKVLIVDEVHACDTYMAKLLNELLAFHASLGGSAILLSATLPLTARQALSAVYQRALGAGAHTLSSDAYPLLTVTSASAPAEHRCEASARSRREVEVRFIHEIDGAIALLKQAAREGKCAVWIRNTVSDAIEAFELLRGTPGVHLFHARFVAGDRQRIEDENLARFGRDSGPEQRRGQILIATQVVEQSLDLDFDLMISDLAPIDLIIQRAGRLHRHPRSLDGRFLGSSPDERPAPVLYLLAPQPTSEPDEAWLSRSPVKRSAFVYDRHWLLWATQQTLARLGAIRTPDQSRQLIEETFRADCPEGLRKQERKATGKELSNRSIAAMSALPFDTGYARDSGRWLDDTRVTTRLGDETSSVRLCRYEAGRPVPFFQLDGLGPALCWQLSEVSVRASWVAAPTDDPRVAEARLAMPDEGRWCVPVVAEPDGQGGWTGQALGPDGKAATFHYSGLVGLFRV